jgi:DNA-directed RNA polymerase alpha subunit
MFSKPISSNYDRDGIKTATFEIHDVDVSVVNAIRRTIMTDVPTVAFSFDPNAKENDIVSHENTGALHNEFLCHRISLLPIHLNKEETNDFDPDQYKFVLNVKNTTNMMLDVTSKDIEIFDASGSKCNKPTHDRLFPVHPITKEHVLITRLKPNLYEENAGDSIHITARASKNSGKVHSRWSPVSKCCYYNMVDDEKAVATLKKRIDDNKDPNIAEEEITKRFELLDKARCYRTNVFEEPNAFVFELQSECGLDPREIFAQGIEYTKIHVDAFKKNVEGRNGVTTQEENGMHYVKVENEGDTLGNLIQATFYNMMVRTDDPVLSYIGYHQPHPLENHIIFKMVIAKKDMSVIDVITQGCDRLIQHLDVVHDAWMKIIV